MEGEFMTMQPKLNKKYVMVDWDQTMGESPEMVKPLFALLKRFGYTPKILTARYENDDNLDIFQWVDKDDVLFSNRQQKKDVLLDFGIKRSDVAFWIDDQPSSIVDKEDLHSLLFYLNS